MSPGSCIVLNNSFEFLSINHWFDAWKLVANGKAEVKASYEQPIRSDRMSMPAPAVVLLKHHVRVGRRRQAFVLPAHRNIWVRVQMRTLTDEEKLEVLVNHSALKGGVSTQKDTMKTSQSHERKAWLGYLRREGLTLF